MEPDDCDFCQCLGLGCGCGCLRFFILMFFVWGFGWGDRRGSWARRHYHRRHRRNDRLHDWPWCGCGYHRGRLVHDWGLLLWGGDEVLAETALTGGLVWHVVRCV